MKGKIVIIGTGALSLGFLGERLAPDYEILFFDKTIKIPILKQVQTEKRYCLNICYLDHIDKVIVMGPLGAGNLENSQEKIYFEESLQEADIIFTAVGAHNLPQVISQIVPVLNKITKKFPILLCENGRHIAEKYQKYFADNVVLVNTIMSKMCRFANPEEDYFLPMWDNAGERLVVESYNYIPLDSSKCSSDQFSNVFTFINSDQFATWEDIKLYAHNGTHAFVAYHAYLYGNHFFSEVSEKLRKTTRRVLFEEICPAIMKAHPAFPPQEIEEYAENLLQRIFNPFFHDSIERGIRGIMEKLQPHERLVSGFRFILSQGMTPLLYGSTIHTAIEIARSKNMISGSVREILREHCGIVEEEFIRIILSDKKEIL